MSSPANTFPKIETIPGFPEKVWRTLQSKHDRQRQRAILSYPWSGRVLEVGSGRGFVACVVAEMHAPDILVGLDPVPSYVRQSRQLADRNETTGFAPVVGHGERLPFGDETFDGALVTEVLEHVRKPLPLMSEVARVLKPDGRAVLTVPSFDAMPPGTVAGHVQNYKIEDFQGLIREAGLCLVEHRTVLDFEFYLVQGETVEGRLDCERSVVSAAKEGAPTDS